MAYSLQCTYAPQFLAGVLGYVCWRARSACTPPVLAGLSGVGFFFRLVLRLRPAAPGWVVGVCVLVCLLRLHPAIPGSGLWSVGWVLPGTFSRAVVRCVLCALPGACGTFWLLLLCSLSVCISFRRCLASLACLLPLHGAPPLVRSDRSRCSAGLYRRRRASWASRAYRGLSPPDLLGCCAGHVEASPEPGSWCLPLAPAEAGLLGSLRVQPVGGTAMGLSLAGPSIVDLGLRGLACGDPVTHTSCFLDRPSFDGGLGRCSGAVLC